jgi:hypothetical protein
MFGLIKRARRYWVSDVSFVTLLLMLFFLVFLFPGIIDIESDNTVLMNLVFLSLFIIGIFSARQKGLMVTAILLVVFHVGLRLIRFSNIPYEFYLLERIIMIINLGLFIYINFSLLFKDNEVSFYRIIGAINVYLSLALLGAFGLELVDIIEGSSIEGNVNLTGKETDFGDFIYYSLTSISTVGFGDVYPVNVHAKMISTFLSVTGVLYPAIIIAKLVSSGSQK